MVTTRAMAKAAEYHFAGPWGVSLMTLGLPIACYMAAFLCNDISGCPTPTALHPSSFSFDKLANEVAWPGIIGLTNTNAMLALLGWYSLSFILFAVLPATEVEGVELSSGGRLKYRFNAFSSSTVTLSVLLLGTLVQGSSFPVWTFIWDNYVALLTGNILISFCLAVYVYIRSFEVKRGNKEKRELAQGGHTGNLIYDWFIGRELNPRIYIPLIGEVDIKTFMEVRPGMLGWVVLDLTFMAHQWHNYGLVTDSMLIVVLSQAAYTLDAHYMEPSITTQIDITTDGFGFMLAFGDLVFLPFTYSLQARYLAVHPVHLGWSGRALIAVVFAIGYYIFRSSNNQKYLFRTNPKDPRVAHLQSIQTKQGSKLLVTGWWGAARHINYLGDWIMSWAYCLPTGIAGYIVQPSSPLRFKAPKGGARIDNPYTLRGGVEVVPGEARGWGMLITYFFMLYFAILLIHRETRDEEKCQEKYGADWTEYKRRVKWRIVPGIY